MKFRPTHHVSALVLSFSLTLASCSLLTADDNVVAGVDFDKLFAPPTELELQAVHAEWNSRDVTPEEFGIVTEEEFTAGSWSGTMRVVWHRMDDAIHYGAIIAPDGDRPRPVLAYLHGGDSGVSMDEIRFVYAAVPALRDEFVLVVPSFRSEALYAGGNTYQSGGSPSPFKGDVEDALALVNATLALVEGADPERIAALGFSRGATVAMLMGIRDPRVQAVVEFFGVTDFYGAFVQDLVKDALRGEPVALPTIQDLNVAIIQPLKEGRLGMERARQELLMRSPIYFAERLTALQVHHGLRDAVVPSSEADALIRTMQALDPLTFEHYLYPEGLHDPLTLPGSSDRAIDFLLRVVDSVTA